MDIFEKQQTIEAVRTVVRARWFYILAILLQGVIVKTFFKNVPLPSGFLISLMFVGILVYNFACWLYLFRSPEKISSLGLKVVKLSQVPAEQLTLSALLYFSGTATKMLMMLYIVPIMVGSSLFKTKGVILVTLSTSFLYSGLVFLEYFGLMPGVPPEVVIQSPTKLLKGEKLLTAGQLIGFNLYIFAAAIYAGYLSGLFRHREKSLIEQTRELTQRTQELTQTKDLVQDALIRSDKARVEVAKAKDELEKANIELRKKIEELEKFYRATVGRELKMVELKKDIKNLQETIKKLERQIVKKK